MIGSSNKLVQAAAGVSPSYGVPFDLESTKTALRNTDGVGDTSEVLNNLYFSSDGLKAIGRRTGTVYSYTFSSPYDVTTISLTSTKSVYSNTLAVSPDGTYFFQYTSGTLERYVMTTPWDVSTSSRTHSVGLTHPVVSLGYTRDIEFDSTGLKLFVSSDDDWVVSYTLSTAWDITTLSVDTTQYDTVAPSTYCYQLQVVGPNLYISGLNGRMYRYLWAFGDSLSAASLQESDTTLNPSSSAYYVASDGGKIWLAGLFNTSNAVLTEHTMATAYSLASVNTTANKTLNMAHGSKCVTFSTDGTYLFVANDSTTLYVYTLSTAFDISTATLTSSPTISRNVYGVSFSSDGTRMFVADAGSFSAKAHSYSLSTAWDPSTATLLSSVEPDTKLGGYFEVSGVIVSPTGDEMLVASPNFFNPGYVARFSLSTAYNFATASYAPPNGMAARTNQLGGSMRLHESTPNKLYFCDDVANREYELSSGFDLTTMSTSATKYVGAGYRYGPRLCQFIDSGTRAVFVGRDALYNSSVFNLALGTAYDISTVDLRYTANAIVLPNISLGASLTAFSFEDSGNILVVNGNKSFWVYNLSTAYDPSTATLWYNLSSSSYYQYRFNPTGTIFTAEGSFGRPISYSLSTPWDIRSVTQIGAIYTNYAAEFGMIFSADGLTYQTIYDSTDQFWIFPLTTPYNVGTFTGTATYATSGLPSISDYNSAIGVAGDGSYAYIGSGKYIYQIPLPTPYDLTTADTASIVSWKATGTSSDTGINAEIFSNAYVCSNGDGSVIYLLAGNQLIPLSIRIPPA